MNIFCNDNVFEISIYFLHTFWWIDWLFVRDLDWNHGFQCHFLKRKCFDRLIHLKSYMDHRGCCCDNVYMTYLCVEWRNHCRRHYSVQRWHFLFRCHHFAFHTDSRFEFEMNQPMIMMRKYCLLVFYSYMHAMVVQSLANLYSEAVHFAPELYISNALCVPSPSWNWQNIK